MSDNLRIDSFEDARLCAKMIDEGMDFVNKKLESPITLGRNIIDRNVRAEALEALNRIDDELEELKIATDFFLGEEENAMKFTQENIDNITKYISDMTNELDNIESQLTPHGYVPFSSNVTNVLPNGSPKVNAPEECLVDQNTLTVDTVKPRISGTPRDKAKTPIIYSKFKDHLQKCSKEKVVSVLNKQAALSDKLYRQECVQFTTNIKKLSNSKLSGDISGIDLLANTSLDNTISSISNYPFKNTDNKLGVTRLSENLQVPLVTVTDNEMNVTFDKMSLSANSNALANVGSTSTSGLALQKENRLKMPVEPVLSDLSMAILSKSNLSMRYKFSK